MVTKLENTKFVTDFSFGEVNFSKPAAKEDMEQGIDGWLCGIPFAWRRRRISLKEYGEVSIRYSRITGNKTEYAKLIGGSFKALIYIFQFIDAVVICRTSDIVDCLRCNKFNIQPNKDGTTKACYIKLADIEHLLLYM